MECPEGGEQESAKGRCEVGNAFQFPLINGEYILFNFLKINYSYEGHIKESAGQGSLVPQILGIFQS